MSATHSPQHRQHGRRKVDLASFALLVCGLVFGFVAYYLITEQGVNPLILSPSVVAVTLGVTHLVKRQAPRDRR